KDGATYHLKSTEKRVRIEAATCNRKDKIEEVFIVNKTNGFVATSFALNTRELTTDLMVLVEGPNHILVSLKLSEGKELQSQIVLNH
ncbi:MAG: hypothetical protein KDD22_06445, partial [Bdellovibrionales bacterium]|nr:hypothetical protein [Bdellovibrionales bacterium]